MDTNPLHENLINWLPAVDLPRLERAYFEAVQVLSSEQFPLTPEDTRSILAQLNTLVARYRDLEVRRQALLGVMSEGKYEKTEQERSMLAQRAEAVDDPLAKRALLQSLRLCEDRAANLGKLKPALERLDAQQEAIVQTIASLHATLVRWQAAPALSDLPDVSEIQQSVVRINDETCAVEQAVQEVVTLNM